MITIAHNTAVINGITESGWPAMIEEAMRSKREIVLILAAFDSATKEKLNKLSETNHYRPPNTLTEERWSEYKNTLNLSDFAVKEQGINRNFVYLIQPAETR